ncbi:uncharacterized protein J3R85_004158 [Psidium guajava]|nr:uncharacterized protein J3R85_004158 [Psidium guajava]
MIRKADKSTRDTKFRMSKAVVNEAMATQIHSRSSPITYLQDCLSIFSLHKACAPMLANFGLVIQDSRTQLLLVTISQEDSMSVAMD